MYYINFIFCDKNVHNLLVLISFKLLYKLVVLLTHPKLLVRLKCESESENNRKRNGDMFLNL
jgi:hypothetical protein